MRILVAVDWSDETFAAVQAVGRMYRPAEVALVHAVDVTPFESPVFAPHIAKEAYADVRDAMVQSGQQLLEQTAALVPAGVDSTRRLCELGAPAEVILDAARATAADLLVLGTRSRGRITELFLGSVSHHVLLHAPCSTLMVKQPLESLRRVLVAIEGAEDAAQIRDWLLGHPFTHRVELTMLRVLPNLHFGDPATELSYASWVEQSEKIAHGLLDELKASLQGDRYAMTTKVTAGFLAQAIAEASQACDLVLVASHGRTGLSRFLLGSVSHAVVHRVACPVLVVRK